MKTIFKFNKKWFGWSIFLILVLALGLRLTSLSQSFWLDEATSGIVARDLSFKQIIINFSPADFHPPLYYILLKVWSLFLGTGEIALRSLSVLFGLAAIYLVFLIGEKLFNRKTGLLASLLLATSGLQEYKQIWLVRYLREMDDPEDNFRKEIENGGYKKNGEYDFNGMVVWIYIGYTKDMNR